MAQFINPTISNGTLRLPTTPNTSSAGYIWFDTTTQRAKYSWCGSIWSVGGALIQARIKLGGAGTQKAGLAFGGTADSTLVSCTEEYNGSSWTANSSLIRARCSLAGAGTQTSALAFGGFSPPSIPQSCTEEYNYGMQQSNFGTPR